MQNTNIRPHKLLSAVIELNILLYYISFVQDDDFMFI